MQYHPIQHFVFCTSKLFNDLQGFEPQVYLPKAPGVIRRPCLLDEPGQLCVTQRLHLVAVSLGVAVPVELAQQGVVPVEFVSNKVSTKE